MKRQVFWSTKAVTLVTLLACSNSLVNANDGADTESSETTTEYVITLELLPGASRDLSATDLEAFLTSHSNVDDSTAFRVETAPVHGTLQLDGTTLVADSRFSIADIKASKVRYVNASVNDDTITATTPGARITFKFTHQASIALTVEPLYGSANAKWNTYVRASDLSQACDGSEPAIYTSCLHAGEAKKVELGVAVDCNELTASDNLDAFDWTCDDSGPTTFIRTVALKDTKGLRDLIESAGTGFRDNAIEVKLNGVVLGTSAAAKWWSNPVRKVTGSTWQTVTGAQGKNANGSNNNTNPVVVSLSDSGNEPVIYTLTEWTYSEPGLRLDSDGLALLTLGSTGISNVAYNKMNCTQTGALGSSASCAVAANSRKFIWLELRGSSDGNRFLTVGSTKFSRLDNLTYDGGGAATVALRLEELSGSKITRLTTGGGSAFEDFVYLKDSTGNLVKDVHITSDADLLWHLRVINSDNNVFKNLRLGNLGRGLGLDSSSGNSFEDISIESSNMPIGIQLENASNNNRFLRSKLRGFNGGTLYGGVDIAQSHSNQFVSTIIQYADVGFSMNSANKNIIADLKVFQSQTAGYLQGTDSIFTGITGMGNKVQNVTVTGDYSIMHEISNVVSLSDGNQISGSHNLFSNFISSTSQGWGLYVSGSQNRLFDVVLDRDQNMPLLSDSGSANQYLGKLIFGEPSVDGNCSVGNDAGTNLDGATCTSTSPSLSVEVGVEIASSFKGRTLDVAGHPQAALIIAGSAGLSAGVLNPTDAAPISPFDFSSPFQTFGTAPGNALLLSQDNAFSCGSWTGSYVADCAVYDWRLRASDTVLRNRFSCPSSTDWVTHTFSDASTVSFLRHTSEVLDDGVGNDDGLCGVNEACVLSPNFGSYQGHGDLVAETSCSIPAAAVGVTLYRYSSNGVP